MLIFNITLMTEKSVGDAVLRQLYTFTETFNTNSTNVKIQLLEMPESQHDAYTYCLQLLGEEQNDMNNSFDKEVVPLIEKFKIEFPNQVMHFSSLMKVLTSPNSL